MVVRLWKEVPSIEVLVYVSPVANPGGPTLESLTTDNYSRHPPNRRIIRPRPIHNDARRLTRPRSSQSESEGYGQARCGA